MDRNAAINQRYPENAYGVFNTELPGVSLWFGAGGHLDLPHGQSSFIE